MFLSAELSSVINFSCLVCTMHGILNDWARLFGLLLN